MHFKKGFLSRWKDGGNKDTLKNGKLSDDV